MTDTTHDIAGLIDQMAQAIDAVRPGGILSSNSKLSAALFALYEAMPALTALQAERDAWKARAEAAEEALTPSGDTKAKYMGEFHFSQTIIGDDGDDVTVKTYVPWTTVKEIMSAIRARANKANALPDEIRALTPPADLAVNTGDN